MTKTRIQPDYQACSLISQQLRDRTVNHTPKVLPPAPNSVHPVCLAKFLKGFNQRLLTCIQNPTSKPYKEPHSWTPPFSTKITTVCQSTWQVKRLAYHYPKLQQVQRPTKLSKDLWIDYQVKRQSHLHLSDCQSLLRAVSTQIQSPTLNLTCPKHWTLTK